MIAINRKQVPLCPEHHRKLHKGSLSAEEREMYSKQVKATSQGPKPEDLFKLIVKK